MSTDNLLHTTPLSILNIFFIVIPTLISLHCFGLSLNTFMLLLQPLLCFLLTSYLSSSLQLPCCIIYSGNPLNPPLSTVILVTSFHRLWAFALLRGLLSLTCMILTLPKPSFYLIFNVFISKFRSLISNSGDQLESFSILWGRGLCLAMALHE